MTPDELKQAADEMVGVFGPYMAIEHCKRVIEVLEMLRKPEYTTFVLKYTEFSKTGEVLSPSITMNGYELTNHYESILSELEGRVK